MRSIAYTRPGLGLLDRPEPEIGDSRAVKIKVAYASLCGSDLHLLRGDFDAMLPEGPLPLGHEASGTVLELASGATSKGLRVGDKVTFYFNRYCGSCYFCRNGQEQFCTAVDSGSGFMSDIIVLDEQQVFPLPADTDLTAAALIEPTSVALRGIDLCNIRPGMTVAVSGGGGIGQIVARLARLSGAIALTVIEPVADKRAVALAGGVDYVIDPASEDAAARAAEITGGHGFDVAIETSGAASACDTSIAIAGRGATVEFLATYRPDYVFQLPMGSAFMREITLVTGVYQSPYLFPRSVAVHNVLHLEDLVTRFSPEDFQSGFDAQSTGSSIKTVFDFTH